MGTWKKACIGIVAVMLCIIFVLGLTPSGRAAFNSWRFGLKKVDETTLYENVKTVEDTCRAMISSYEADKAVYTQYNTSDNTEKQSWAEQAKMRANKTAATYNNYIMKNSFVWKDNVPADIFLALQAIE